MAGLELSLVAMCFCPLYWAITVIFVRKRKRQTSSALRVIEIEKWERDVEEFKKLVELAADTKSSSIFTQT